MTTGVPRLSPVDPLSLAAAAALLSLVTELSVWLPARRAARADPSAAYMPALIFLVSAIGTASAQSTEAPRYRLSLRRSHACARRKSCRTTCTDLPSTSADSSAVIPPK
jgi:hypothetical protein